MRQLRFTMLALAIAAAANTARAALPAFPGAKGFGTDTAHGRGGRVIKVTSLADSGAGTLREALLSTETRIIVFDVSGIIKLRSQVTIAAANSHFYLAGQSAPGTGVVVVGQTIKIDGASDFLIRHMRFRRGDYRYMGGAGECDTLWINGATNAVIDHCSVEWGCDGSMDLKMFNNFTVSNTIIGNGCNEAIHDQDSDWWHNKLMILGGDFSRIQNKQLSLYRNLFCHGDDRPPQITNAGTGDLVNNVFVANNRASIISVAGNFLLNPDFGWQVNIIGNYWRNIGDPQKSLAFGFYDDGRGPAHPNTRIYLEGNCNNFYAPAGAAGEQPNIVLAVELFTTNIVPTRLNVGTPPYAYDVLPYSQAYATVLANVGATVPKRDFVDADLLQRVANGQYSIDTALWGPYPFYNYVKVGMDSQLQVTGHGYFNHDFSGVAPADNDNDGLPNDWEDAHGLNKNNASDNTTVMPSGYTAIEEYLNGLASGPDEPMPNRDLPKPSECLFDRGFEYGLCNWRTRNCAIREWTADFHSGTVCAQIHSRKADQRTYLQQRIIDDLTRLGQGRYDAEARVKLAAGEAPTTAVLEVFWFDEITTHVRVARTVTFSTATVTATEWTKLSGSGDITWTQFWKSDSAWPGGAYFAVELPDDLKANYFVDDCHLGRSTPQASVVDREDCYSDGVHPAQGKRPDMGVGAAP